MVAPDLRGRGLGPWLLAHAEAAAPRRDRLSLFTGRGSATTCGCTSGRLPRDRASPTTRRACTSASRALTGCAAPIRRTPVLWQT
jgi:GNAT superfamily N-acetyltransferase